MNYAVLRVDIHKKRLNAPNTDYFGTVKWYYFNVFVARYLMDINDQVSP